MANNVELDPLVERYQHESHRPRANEALFMLKKIASMVKPIMRRRHWKVGLLAEFFPAQTNLLGLNTNRGQIINLRLRYPGDHTQFLPLEDVVDTMLHELCHNEIGPHNQQFHALWDQLRDEHEALVRKGYSGEGFLGRGARLGGQGLPLHEARRRARAAAERRKVMNAGSGQRLGGSNISRGQDARAVIAAAVERRLRVERGCASNTETGRQVAQDEANKKESVTTTRAEREDQDEATMMQAFIDLIEEEESQLYGPGYKPPSSSNPAGPRHSFQSNQRGQSLIEQQRDIERQILKDKQNQSIDIPSVHQNAAAVSKTLQTEPELDTWTCEICTLVNPFSFLSCDACGIERPSRYAKPPIPLTSKPKVNVSAPQSERERPNALKPRLSSTQAYEKFERERAEKVASKPVGWVCQGCGTFMEQEWWTCSACGRMKGSS